MDSSSDPQLTPQLRVDMGVDVGSSPGHPGRCISLHHLFHAVTLCSTEGLHRVAGKDLGLAGTFGWVGPRVESISLLHLISGLLVRTVEDCCGLCEIAGGLGVTGCEGAWGIKERQE